MTQIKTKRLILRELGMDDLDAVQEYASDPQTVRYLNFGPNTVAQTKEFLKKIVTERKQKKRKYFNLGIVLKKETRLIGACRIYIQSEQHKRGSIGYVLNRKYWGYGYATETAKALINFGFKTLKLHRICAYCRPKNIASAKVMENCGMKYEGHLRHHVFVKNKWCDNLCYAIIKK